MTEDGASSRSRPIRSCQRCRNFKVRCSRARPRCKRCIVADVDCVYAFGGTPFTGISPRSESSVELVVSEAQPGNPRHSAKKRRLGDNDRAQVPFQATFMLQQRSRPERKSPDGMRPNSVAKRERAILSCLRCRKLKVRCDRGVPCTRCANNHRKLECVYSDLSISGFSNTHPVHLNNSNALGGVATYFVDNYWDQRFHNGTHWKNLLHEIEELLHRTPGEHTGDLSNGDPHPHSSAGAPVVLSINYPFSDHDNSHQSITLLLNNLPPRSTLEAFIAHYMDTIEKTYHLLDTDAFETEVRDFWSWKRGSAKPRPDDGWLAQYFMIISLGCQAHEFIAQATKSNGYSDLPNRLLTGAEMCLRRTPFLFQPTLTNIRTLCLMVISKQVYTMSCHQSDTCWPLTGMIIRLAMGIGLHTDRLPIVELWSCHERRMRRRLWASVVFLEMRQSLICGMPLLLRPCDVACLSKGTPSPSFNNTTPSSAIENHSWTSSPVSADSEPTLLESTFGTAVPLLIQAIDLATGDTDDPATYTQVVQVDEALRNLIRSSGVGLRPPVFRTDTDWPSSTSIDLEACTLDIFFRQTLLALHSRFVLGSTTCAAAAHPDSGLSSLESALAVLSLQRSLCDGDGCEPAQNSSTAWFAGLFRYEFFTAAMTVCCQLVRGLVVEEGPMAVRREDGPAGIMLEALKSCRDIWSRERSASVCNGKAHALVDKLVEVLQGSR
ncbi:hypothetical protein P152DRAFT_423360 [Eremomyces bilateralis CBS 781.70]|uniref:Zn(2)-C6 fungal-type domain-containing protein n=1 Tax=Eremomyces bilateralis CBS 781.70 TaxID=1392243 RepID=A0A6G1FTU7_9PEZI|nr:uncharacterized protein P152DRAFT_423360 [Eremomyces bilateralis CBS 781.70]KAF1809112.1 hypothetical protein P152DRAFT_423360 [Eremomyces bilateralis CBS 781.70]